MCINAQGVNSVGFVDRGTRRDNPEHTAKRRKSSARPSSSPPTDGAASAVEAESIPPALCIFEYVYFSRPDSAMQGQTVHSVRQRCGAQLFREAPVEADVVSTVPTSATPAALGFAHASGIPYNEVLSKNHYVGRTFIQPDQRLRRLGVKKKFSPIVDNIKGKRVVIVDDSIVRGTTMGPILRMLRDAGAKEVHIRVASPPLKHPVRGVARRSKPLSRGRTGTACGGGQPHSRPR